MSDAVRVVVKVVARSETIAEITGIILKLAAHRARKPAASATRFFRTRAMRKIFYLIEEWTNVAALDARNRQDRALP